MDPLNLGWIEEVIGAQRFGCPREKLVTGITTDSRQVDKGHVFFALSGDNFDGRRFVEAAFEQGAAAAVITASEGDQQKTWPGPVLLVDDSKLALGRLGKAYRETLKATVICITGSVGKTTTKDMIFTAMDGERDVVRAQRSFNNDIGVPLTLLSASRSSEVVIVEVGTNAPGEIAALGAIAQPDIAVLTGIGFSHLQGLNSLSEVAKEKVSLLHYIRPGGVAFFNGDDLRCRAMAAAHKEIKGAQSTYTVGFQDDCDWTGLVTTCVTAVSGSRSRMRLTRGIEIALSIPGVHNLRNALMAYAIAVKCGVRPRIVAQNLTRFRAAPGRLNAVRTPAWTILDDCYNANPTSMRAALETFTVFASDRKRIAVLGSMLELGKDSQSYHKAIGRLACRYGINTLIIVGEEAKDIAREALRLGFDPASVKVYDTAAEARFSPLLHCEAGAAVLVKGSRGVGLEIVVSDLCQRNLSTEGVLSVA
jgi:UDP-N-acetylmuramoyl-tripeptide--D-alanyl-D-alanine ligase